MKRYRVWAYETIGHYIEIDAQNKSDAYNKAMDVNVLDWIQSGGDEIGDLNTFLPNIALLIFTFFVIMFYYLFCYIFLFFSY